MQGYTSSEPEMENMVCISVIFCYRGLQSNENRLLLLSPVGICLHYNQVGHILNTFTSDLHHLDQAYPNI